MNNVRIGKFEIFATFGYTSKVMSGEPRSEAKAYGIFLAVMGARGTGGKKSGSSFYPGKNVNDILKKASTKKESKHTFTSEDFDRQVMRKLGDHFNDFVDAMTNLIGRGFTYNQIKELVQIPSTRGAKISLAQFIAYSN